VVVSLSTSGSHHSPVKAVKTKKTVKQGVTGSMNVRGHVDIEEIVVRPSTLRLVRSSARGLWITLRDCGRSGLAFSYWQYSCLGTLPLLWHFLAQQLYMSLLACDEEQWALPSTEMETLRRPDRFACIGWSFRSGGDGGSTNHDKLSYVL
jgi:hypothetical protein